MDGLAAYIEAPRQCFLGREGIANSERAQ